MGKKRRKRLTLLCGLPQDVLTSGARATLFGRGCVMIEGQHGVVELGTASIRLKTREGIVTVAGEGLELKELSADAAMIEGERVDTVTYGKAAEI